MRLFVAVNLPPDEKEKVYRACSPLRNAGLPVRWVAQDSLHLTLVFLGEVPESNADAIRDVLAQAGTRHAPFTMQLGGAGAFPTLRRPRVLWLGVDAAGALIALQADVERSLEPLGFRPETRAYSPHLTVGRVEREARAAAFAELETVAHTITYRSTVAIETVDLMRSQLSRAGARYERVAALPLERKESGRDS